MIEYLSCKIFFPRLDARPGWVRKIVRKVVKHGRKVVRKVIKGGKKVIKKVKKIFRSISLKRFYFSFLTYAPRSLDETACNHKSMIELIVLYN